MIITNLRNLSKSVYTKFKLFSVRKILNSTYIYFSDSVFSERYMQMPWPEDNYAGYQEADVNKKAAQIKDKKLLLIHGTADGKYIYK